jgi:hypothetical protein
MAVGLPIAEDALQEAVIGCARTFGWRVAHFRPARVMRGGKETWETPVSADGKGFPDLVLVRGGRLIFAELKSTTGKTSADQDAWLAELRLACPETYVWEPSRWLDGTIERVLR